MSLIIIWSKSDRILVGVDTLTRDATGQLFEASKAYPLPHLNALVFGRGSAGVLLSIWGRFLGHVSLDRVLAEAPVVAAQVCGEAQLAHGGMEALQSQQEIVFAGWSDQEQRLVCRAFQWMPKGGMHTGYISGAACGGWDHDAGPMPEPSTADAMVGIAVTAVQHSQKKMPSYPIGGRLLVTEMTRASMSFVSRRIE
jgi:hypothetical protein